MLVRQQRLEQLSNMKKEKQLELITGEKRMAAEVFNSDSKIVKKVKKDHRDQSEIEEEQMLEEFDIFNDDYKGLLHEIN